MLSKPILLAAGGLVVAAVAAAAMFLFMGLSGSDGSTADGEEQAAPEEITPVHVEGKLGPHITLDDRVFALVSSVEAPRYVKLRIVLEFETEDPSWFELSGEALVLRLEEFAEEVPIVLIEDAITTTVSRKSADDLASPEGRETLRQEIRDAVTAMLGEPPVRRVLFTNFVTQ